MTAIMAKRKTQRANWPQRLKALRERHGLTQAAAANKAGVALRTWINWENAHRTPGGPTAKLLKLIFPDL